MIRVEIEGEAEKVHTAHVQLKAIIRAAYVQRSQITHRITF